MYWQCGRLCCGKQQPERSQLNRGQSFVAEGVNMHRESMTEEEYRSGAAAL